MKTVYSSHIAAIGYDESAKRLDVEYQTGKKAAYMNVPPEVARNVVNAPSVGSALHQLVRGRFEFGYVEDEAGVE
jgi:hypothetical protein